MQRILLIVAAVVMMGKMAFGQENFIPERPDNISEAQFRRGKLMLENSWKQVTEDDFKILASDYWNFAVSYQIMGQPREMIYDFLWKSKTTEKEKFCEIVNHLLKDNPIDSLSFYKLLGEDFRELISGCSHVAKNSFDVDKYISENSYNKELIYRLNKLLIEDQKGLRTATDSSGANIKEAEKIIEQYGYPGTKMVGPKFDFVVWIVIQHAELKYQEKYLSLIANAVHQKELGKTCLRMLLDRIYTKKIGRQIFGSQAGVPFADDKTIEEVKSKHSLK